jgi:hypothetical protein
VAELERLTQVGAAATDQFELRLDGHNPLH